MLTRQHPLPKDHVIQLGKHYVDHKSGEVFSVERSPVDLTRGLYCAQTINQTVQHRTKRKSGNIKRRFKPIATSFELVPSTAFDMYTVQIKKGIYASLDPSLSSMSKSESVADWLVGMANCPLQFDASHPTSSDTVAD
jgi:hypothetical protein